jgi:nuclease S1
MPFTLNHQVKEYSEPSSEEGGMRYFLIVATALVGLCGNARAWGDEGHEVVALVAQSFLDTDVRKRVAALLAADTSPLTTHDIASEATWADKFRDANIDGSAELANPATDLEEQVAALKYVLHFVGDLHQPLHSSDDHDRGGNNKRVSATGFKAGNLHHFWDTEFVDQLGDAKTIASDLIGHITKDQQNQWQAGAPADWDWAKESFKMAKDDAYRQLPDPNPHGGFRLSDDYVTTATNHVSLQFSKAGIRLTMILNQALRKQP